MCVPKKWLKQLGFDAEQKTYSNGLGVHPDGKEIWTYRDWENDRDYWVGRFWREVEMLRKEKSLLEEQKGRWEVEERPEVKDAIKVSIREIRESQQALLKRLQETRDDLIKFGAYNSTMWPQEFPAS